MKQAPVGGDQTDQAGTPHVYNELGIIAEHYRDLQGLPVLEAARHAYPLPTASDASAIRAVFQAVEIAILNLADVMARAAVDVEHGDFAPASVKICWARGFHRVLMRLSTIPHQLGLPCPANCSGCLRIADSPALRHYVSALERFDRELLTQINAGAFDLERTIGSESLDSPLFTLVHSARVSSHEATIWERNLCEVPVSAPVPSYDEFVVARIMRDAVYDRVLKGDTYFTQFRGLHQIPETLGEEANDHIEQAIRDIRAERIRAALAHLRCVTALMDGMLVALPPMADNLATSDYHVIRENLGLTSGSHSVCLRFHMFTDLYAQLAKAIEQGLTGSDTAANPDAVAAAVRAVDELRLDDPGAWLYHQLVNEGLAIRSCILQWREQHLHLPRNNLGGGYTKSLTGSPDAVMAVEKMRKAARSTDPMLAVARARGLAGTASDDNSGDLSDYIDSETSLDARVLRCTGEVTQRRFVAVQERLGFFANRCPFAAPPHRLA